MNGQSEQHGQEVQPHPCHQYPEVLHPDDLTGDQKGDSYRGIPAG